MNTNVHIKKVIDGLLLIYTLGTLTSLSAMNFNTGNVNEDFFNAIEHGDLEKVEKMVDENSELLNAVDWLKRPALMRAIETNQYKVTNFLIEHRANVNCANECGVTPLMRAIIKEDMNTIDALVATGAQGDTKTLFGETIEHLLLDKDPEIARRIRAILEKALLREHIDLPPVLQELSVEVEDTDNAGKVARAAKNLSAEV